MVKRGYKKEQKRYRKVYHLPLNYSIKVAISQRWYKKSTKRGYKNLEWMYHLFVRVLFGVYKLSAIVYNGFINSINYQQEESKR